MSHESAATSELTAPRSRFYQGPFGRLFDDLDPWRPVDAAGAPITDAQDLEQWCLTVANTLMLESVEADGTPTLPRDIDEDAMDAAFGSTIPAGYTYFGQFVDHDITFDPASSLLRQNDPNKLLNFRTPRLDLDNLYGRGPDDQPYLYDTASAVPGKFLLGTEIASAPVPLHDLPRNEQGRALIGDPRNDENSIVSQLHLAFLSAHNTLVDRAAAQGIADAFTAARTTLRWLYQWVVWHDFINRIVDPDIHAAALTTSPTPDGRIIWTRGLKDVYDWKDQPYMPVEFAGAAYRFGHSMVRSKYKTNIHRGFTDAHFVPIFDNSPGATGDDLRGFRPVGIDNTIQWDWFLQMNTSAGPEFPQRAHTIDTKLTNALAFLHEGPVGGANNVLASRNILRGIRLELPSGHDVALRFGLTPIEITPEEPGSLWYYLLKEAETTAGGDHLGTVGSIIVASVFAGLLAGDPQSWINRQPGWTPNIDALLHPGEDNQDSPDPIAWGLTSIIRIAGVPTDGGQFPDP